MNHFGFIFRFLFNHFQHSAEIHTVAELLICSVERFPERNIDMGGLAGQGTGADDVAYSLDRKVVGLVEIILVDLQK